MYELKWIQFPSEENKIYKSIFGGYNEFPPNWEKNNNCNLLETPKWIDFRQMYFPFGTNFEDRAPYLKNKYTEAKLHILKDGKGFAIVRNWTGNHGWDFQFYSFDAYDSLKTFYKTLSIKTDTGWKINTLYSNTRRGIFDYDRTIKLNQDLTETEMSFLVMFLYRDNCPGWTGITTRKVPHGSSGHEYRFCTTNDSSD